MILVDSNIFVINKVFTNDSNYQESHRLIERLPYLEFCVNVYNYFEICVVLSLIFQPTNYTTFFTILGFIKPDPSLFFNCFFCGFLFCG